MPVNYAEEKPAVCIVGGFQIGKSTLLNCLLDDRYAPTGNGLRTTSCCTRFRYGETEEARHFHGEDDTDGELLPRREELFAPDRVPAFGDHFEVFAWKPLLQEVDIIDTPGYNANDEDDRTASAAIRKASVVVIVQAGKSMDEICRKIVRQACVPGKMCIFLYNCCNTECWSPDEEQNADICRGIEAELGNMGVLDSFLRIEGRIVFPVNAFWAWYAHLQHDRNSPDVNLRESAQKGVRKIECYMRDELDIEPSPSEIIRRSGIVAVRERLRACGKSEIRKWTERRFGEIREKIDVYAPVVRQKLEETGRQIQETAGKYAPIAQEKLATASKATVKTVCSLWEKGRLAIRGKFK